MSNLAKSNWVVVQKSADTVAITPLPVGLLPEGLVREIDTLLREIASAHPTYHAAFEVFILHSSLQSL